jgi:hypothetical protein
MEQKDTDSEIKNNYKKIESGNLHLLNSMDEIQLYDVLSYSKKLATEIAINHNIKDINRTPKESLETNLEYQCAKETHDIIEKRYDEIISNLNLKRNTKDIGTNEPELPKEKLVWLGKPAQLGFIINELIENGYIKELSYSKLSKICLELFDINTTKGNLENELNPNKNSLSPKKQKIFKIPPMDELN